MSESLFIFKKHKILLQSNLYWDNYTVSVLFGLLMLSQLRLYRSSMIKLCPDCQISPCIIWHSGLLSCFSVLGQKIMSPPAIVWLPETCVLSNILYRLPLLLLCPPLFMELDRVYFCRDFTFADKNMSLLIKDLTDLIMFSLIWR